MVVVKENAVDCNPLNNIKWMALSKKQEKLLGRVCRWKQWPFKTQNEFIKQKVPFQSP